MKASKISPTSPDKIKGKFVKYRKGDCLSIRYPDGYLAALITEKFNKYYDFTFIEYFKPEKPTLSDFIQGRFFGTRMGSWEDLTYVCDKRMIDCKYVDGQINFEKIGEIQFKVEKGSYSYIKDLDELRAYYFQEIPVRIEKTNNAIKFPEIAFASKHLVEMSKILDNNYR